MRVYKLTDAAVRAYKSNGTNDVDYTEKGGFGVRVRKTGAKSFFYRYRFQGKVRFMTLGVYFDESKKIKKPSEGSENKSLVEARDKYTAAWKLRKKGLDPIDVNKEEESQKRQLEIDIKREEERKQEEDLKAQEEKANALTVTKLISLYIEEYSKKEKRSWHKDELVLNCDDLKHWGNRYAADLEKNDLLKVVQAIRKRGASGQAQNVLEAVRAMYNWAVDVSGYLEATPFVRIKRITNKQKVDRALTEREIKTFWLESDEADMSDEIRLALKLTLVTCQRPGEVIEMQSHELVGRWWTIPKEKAKNKIAHRVYLTDLALDLIGPLETIDFDTGELRQRNHIFPCPHVKKNKSIGEGSLGHAVRKNFKSGKLTIQKFTPRDLRRTGVTNLARLKVPREWRERIVNHQKEELDAIYNLYEYDDEKQESMQKWEEELRRILAI